MTVKLDGFVILTPINPWDEKYKDVILGRGCYYSFGLTAREAWLRWLGITNDNPDASIKIQNAMDRGYRIALATLEVYDEVSQGRHSTN